LTESPDSKTDKTLLIFGDSFFRVMLNQLAWGFRRVVFCRSAYFHSELVDAVKPDVIFGGAAERYLADVAPDDVRPHFLAYTLLAGRKMAPEPGFAELFAKFFDQASLTGVGHK
jgi:hypothetical protein